MLTAEKERQEVPLERRLEWFDGQANVFAKMHIEARHSDRHDFLTDPYQWG